MWLENLIESPPEDFDIVTGAFGFSGKYIARRLLQMGRRVRTLTNHVPPHPDPRIEPLRLDFSDFHALVARLRGAKVLYNSYWIRFAHDGLTHATAVENSQRLIRAAEEAGVERIVHVSITNPSPDSPLSYFRGKAQVEAAIVGSRLSYAILRPAVLFGDEDILINNIAWLLRHFPVFAVPGRGEYALQPIFVDDLAALAVEQGQRRENLVVDAVGPDTYSYGELVRIIRDAVRSRSRIVHLPPSLVTLAASALSWRLHDVVLTKEEVRGLMANLLVVNANGHQPRAGTTSLKRWLEAHASTVGTTYASELRRHYSTLPAGRAAHL